MGARDQHVIDFYVNHPISAEHIMARLREERGSLDDVRPEELYPLDEDHYGALDANEALAERTGMAAGDRVLDLCAGLCGPARWFARQRGVTVVGLDITPVRVEGAKELNALVGLQDAVEPVLGDAMDLPFADASFDAAVSQEAFLHIPDKLRALREIHRVLRPGKRVSFTDWIMPRPLPQAEQDRMWAGFGAQALQSIPGYEALLRKAGFAVVSAEDTTESWGEILAKRLEMYRRLNAEAEAAGHPSEKQGFIEDYTAFVTDVQTHRLGGARLTAEKPG